MTDPVKCTQCDARILDMPKHLAKRHSGAPRPSLEANTAPVSDPEADTGFSVRIKVQDYVKVPGAEVRISRKTLGLLRFVGVDEKSNIAHFLAGRAPQQAELARAVDAKEFPTVVVKGYQFVRYDGARGAWYNANLTDQKGR